MSVVMAATGSSAGAAPQTWDAATVTGLVTAGAALLLSLAAIVLALRLKEWMAQAKPKHVEFVDALKKDVKAYSERADANMLAKMSAVPASVEALRANLRMLVNELAEPMAYIDRMGAVPVATFPEHDMSSAFGTWSAATRALHGSIDRFYSDSTYAGDQIGHDREKYLLSQYQAEYAHILKQRERAKDAADKLVKIADKYLEKHQPKI